MSRGAEEGRGGVWWEEDGGSVGHGDGLGGGGGVYELSGYDEGGKGSSRDEGLGSVKMACVEV